MEHPQFLDVRRSTDRAAHRRQREAALAAQLNRHAISRADYHHAMSDLAAWLAAALSVIARWRSGLAWRSCRSGPSRLA